MCRGGKGQELDCSGWNPGVELIGVEWSYNREQWSVGQVKLFDNYNPIFIHPQLFISPNWLYLIGLTTESLNLVSPSVTHTNTKLIVGLQRLGVR
jgi:hypothetical protein